MSAPRYLLHLRPRWRVERVAAHPRHCLNRLSAGQTQLVQLWTNRHVRLQHTDSDNSPHKEYFQVPGKEPKPDLTPYVRSSQQGPQNQSSLQSSRSTSLAQSTSAQDPLPPPPLPTPKGWQRIPRFVRSVVWVLLFLQLGVAAGTALITWEYLSPPFEPGSPEDEELVEEILETLETHPMVEDLRQNEWIEVEAYTPDLRHGIRGRNLVHQVLGANNTQGVFMKVFHHPTQEFTMLVFFLGFGVEGWPDVIHGGLTSTLLQEAVSKHIGYYYPTCFTTPDSKTKIDFKKPCKPGDVYGILVAPSGRKAIVSGNVPLTELQITGLLVQLNGAPLVASDFNLSTNVETHTVSIPAQKGHQPTHVICQSEIKVVPKQVSQDGKAYEVGGNADGGFTRALDFLRTRPEFQNTQPPPPVSEEEKDGEDD